MISISNYLFQRRLNHHHSFGFHSRKRIEVDNLRPFLRYSFLKDDTKEKDEENVTPVFLGCFSPDCEKIAFSTENNVILVVKIDNYDHNGKINVRKFSDAGYKMVSEILWKDQGIFTASMDKKIILRRSDNGKIKYCFDHHKEWIKKIRVFGERLYSGDIMGVVNIFDLEKQMMTCKIKYEGDCPLKLNCVSGISEKYDDDNLFVIGYKTGKVRMYDLRLKNKQINCFKAHQSTANTLFYKNNDNLLVTGGRDSLVKVWDLRKTENGCLHEFFSHQSNTHVLPMSMAFDSYVMQGSEDGKFCLYNLENFEDEKVFDFHNFPVHIVASSQSYILTSSIHGERVYLWKPMFDHYPKYKEKEERNILGIKELRGERVMSKIIRDFGDDILYDFHRNSEDFSHEEFRVSITRQFINNPSLQSRLGIFGLEDEMEELELLGKEKREQDEILKNFCVDELD